MIFNRRGVKSDIFFQSSYRRQHNCDFSPLHWTVFWLINRPTSPFCVTGRLGREENWTKESVRIADDNAFPLFPSPLACLVGLTTFELFLFCWIPNESSRVGESPTGIFSLTLFGWTDGQYVDQQMRNLSVMERNTCELLLASQWIRTE